MEEGTKGRRDEVEEEEQAGREEEGTGKAERGKAQVATGLEADATME